MVTAISSEYNSLPAYNARMLDYYNQKLYDYQESERVNKNYVRQKDTEELTLYRYNATLKEVAEYKYQQTLGQVIDSYA
jgi:hypothetical protein